LKVFAAWLVGRGTRYVVLTLALALTLFSAAYVGLLAREPGWHIPIVLLLGFAVSGMLFAIATAGRSARVKAASELDQAEAALVTHRERLRILHAIDQAVVAAESPEKIAGAVIERLRELLGVPRAIVNLFDLAKGEVEWLAAAGRRRAHFGPGVRYSLRLMGDVEALRRGDPQIIDTHKLPPGPEVDALLASGIELYMAVPMIAGGELIGAISFGGPPGPFHREQVAIAIEVATQLAIAIVQARLRERLSRQAQELEIRVRERTRELEAANKELESFSYSVSHDLRGPLRSIDGFSQLLASEYHDKLDDNGRRYLGRIRASAQRMGELIDDLLLLAQVSRAELHREPVNISDIARAAVAELRANEPGRSVRCEIQDGLTGEADQRLTRVMLDNLLGNAWKFTSKTQDPRIEFGADRRDAIPAYFVRDNGAGFDMAYSEKLFHPFQRLHRDSEFAGTGIGLATVHRIVTRHGGRVWAQGRVDGGATFFFTLTSPYNPDANR
jgi:signal transduction histidine kinase